MDRRTFLSIALAAPAFSETAAAFTQTQKPAAKSKSAVAQWTQWGGPRRNFQTEASGLKDVWPAAGPRVVWKQSSATGIRHLQSKTAFSTQCTRNRELRSCSPPMPRRARLSGNTRPRWGFESDAPEMGNGPYSSPLVVGDRLFTTGVAGRLQCLDKKTGKVIWTQDLWASHQGSRLMYGYSSSPLAFRETIIVPVGGAGKSVMAFQQADGKVAWAKGDVLGNVYSSPLLINVGGLEQAALLMDGAMIAVNPLNGDLQWQVPFKADYSIAIATPVWGPDNLLFISAEYNGGAKVIELQRSNQQTKATELWSSNRLRLHHSNAMRIGDAIYFSSGGKGSQAILSSVDARTGTIHWQERSIQKASFVWADQKLITIAQDGMLMIAYPSPQGFKIAAKAQVLTELAWTPPVTRGHAALPSRSPDYDGRRPRVRSFSWSRRSTRLPEERPVFRYSNHSVATVAGGQADDVEPVEQALKEPPLLDERPQWHRRHGDDLRDRAEASEPIVELDLLQERQRRHITNQKRRGLVLWEVQKAGKRTNAQPPGIQLTDLVERRRDRHVRALNEHVEVWIAEHYASEPRILGSQQANRMKGAARDLLARSFRRALPENLTV